MAFIFCICKILHIIIINTLSNQCNGDIPSKYRLCKVERPFYTLVGFLFFDRFLNLFPIVFCV